MDSIENPLTKEPLAVTLYSRDDCSLCDQALEDLESLNGEIPHKVTTINIDSEKFLIEKYGELVPVVEVGPFVKKAPFTRDELRITLMAAQDRLAQLESIDDPGYRLRKERARTITRMDKISYAITAHYLKGLIILVFLYVGLPFLAPVLMNSGFTTPATIIYRFYGAVCHQFAFRSWFLYGEQIAYPRAAAAGEGVVPYSVATGRDEADIFDARSYLGEQGVGYKVAFCQRDVAIYAGILIFGLIFAASGSRLRSLPWYLWLLIGVLPIGLDGFSQLLSQPPFSLWDYRESTPLLRSLTGFIFGFTTGWLGIPLVDEAMKETRRTLTIKFSRSG